MKRVRLDKERRSREVETLFSRKETSVVNGPRKEMSFEWTRTRSRERAERLAFASDPLTRRRTVFYWRSHLSGGVKTSWQLNALSALSPRTKPTRSLACMREASSPAGKLAVKCFMYPAMKGTHRISGWFCVKLAGCEEELWIVLVKD